MVFLLWCDLVELLQTIDPLISEIIFSITTIYSSCACTPASCAAAKDFCCKNNLEDQSMFWGCRGDLGGTMI